MKWLSAGLIFVNLSTVCGLLLGMAGNGLNELSAVLALVSGGTFALAAYLGTSDPATQHNISNSPAGDSLRSPPRKRYRHVWFWAMAACFALFALRSFCWLLYIDGEQLKIQSPNNLGDLALHITYIRYFANGVSLWPANPIYVFSEHLRYPAGMDLFNALLSYLHVDLIRGLVWTGLLASIATFYAFFRWAGLFGIAGFLFNGGVAGFEFLKTLKFVDYQGGKTIAWKSIPLTMFVTQRGLLYAIPAGLLLLWSWRERFFRIGERNRHRAPLAFWVELALYASMPLFHLHTFLALSIVLVCLFGLELFNQLKLPVDVIRREGIAGLRSLITCMARWGELFGDTRIRKHVALLLVSSVVPATFFVWLVTDHFHARSVLEWHPGWVQNDGEFATPFFQIGPVNLTAAIPLFGWLLQKTWNGAIAPFFQFWLMNFGIWVPLVFALIGLSGWNAWKSSWRWGKNPPEDVGFLFPASAIFVFAFFVQTAPWGWDNLKLMIWAYFLVLPFLWTDLIARWTIPARIGVCIALFGSGFISLFGGLAAGRPGFEFSDRGELDAVGVAVRKLPAEARFAAYPTYNHPLLLQGRKVVLGYPGHLWTEGFEYTDVYDWLTKLMQGSGDWRKIARALQVRYLFWGREEMINFPASKRPWEATAPLVASGNWGAIYDLEATAVRP
jgi:hypothetical protein